MSAMLLVDSSVWIGHYRNKLDPATLRMLTRALEDHRAVLAPMIWLELMVGFRSAQERAHLENVRAVALWVELPASVWERAGEIASRLYSNGVVLRMPDLLVLTMADAGNFKLLHCDKDFDRVLKLREFARLRVELQD